MGEFFRTVTLVFSLVLRREFRHGPGREVCQFAMDIGARGKATFAIVNPSRLSGGI
jgi:hypothetical protein